MKHLYSIVKNHEQVELTTSLRTAKEAARRLGAELVIEFDPIVTVEKQTLVPRQVFVYCQNLGIFESWAWGMYVCSYHYKFYAAQINTLVDTL